MSGPAAAGGTGVGGGEAIQAQIEVGAGRAADAGDVGDVLLAVVALEEGPPDGRGG